MKTLKYIQSKIVLPVALMALTLVGCERDLSDDVVLATFPTTAEIFIDAPVGLTDQFFRSFDPAVGANTNGFGVDNTIFYEGTASIRVDVPASNDPDGGFIGGIFEDRGEGRDLSGYDALTFWARGSTSGTVLVGFGTDFDRPTDQPSYNVETAIQMSTGWRKYTIPIPDPSKLTQESGMFLFSAGGFDPLGDGPNGNEVAWTFWIDELKFENLGTNLRVGSTILDGADLTNEGFTGTTVTLSGFTETTNLASGQNVTTSISGDYFDFAASAPGVATVSSRGVVSVIGSTGIATITGSLDGTPASGSLTITSNGELPHAPIPTRDAANVVSLFSDAYTNVPVRHYNGFFQFATTQGGAGNDPNNVDIQDPFPGGGLDNIISYTQLNFVSIGTYETVALPDISQMTHLHVDINIREAVDSGDFIRLSIETGTGTGSTTAGNFILNATALGNTNADGWLTLDIPLASFPGLTGNDLGQVFFVSDATISNIWVDNVYFYRN